MTTNQSRCCGQSVSRPVPGLGVWTCDNCGRPASANPTLADKAQALIAQAMDYSAAADKARHEPHLEAVHTAALQATIKALAIVMETSEAEAHEVFMDVLPA